MSSKLGKLPYDEPPMYLQRPSSGSSQDVTHILARTFRDLFTRDFVEQETVKNLHKSRTGDDSYHEKYVEELRKVQLERERRMAEASMLERHIMQARAKSMAEDEKELNKIASECDIYHDLGLPPVQSHFKHCLDSDLLKAHGLIVPEDFSTVEPPLSHAPKASNQPHYAEATQTSTKRILSADKEHAEVRLRHAQEIQQKKSSKGKSKGRKGEIWKEDLSPMAREQNRKDMTMVFKKADFLRNPRHRPPSELSGKRTLIKPNTVGHQLGGAKTTVVDASKKEPSVVFLPTPSTVAFSEYQVGKVYEATLDLKNVSAASRPLRVIPPKTQYFHVGLGKFPGEQGIVAPGMSCQYNIRFMPDSLMDFEDELIIQTQSSSPVTVKLLSKRQPPVLTLPSVIDCGYCLTGGQVLREFVIKNEGGGGRFCMMSREAWPATNFKTLSSGDKTELDQFVIEPAMFELLPGHAISMMVTFSPNETAVFEREIVMVCDNCTVKNFTLRGEGQRAGVILKSVQGGESSPAAGELCDASAQHHIHFNPVNPMTFDTKQIVLQNTTNVDLPFYWACYKPIPVNPTPEEHPADNAPRAAQPVRVPDTSFTFYVNPEQGTVPAGGRTKATIAFSPPGLGKFNSVLHLLLRDIPEVTLKDSSSSSIESSGKTLGKKSSNQAVFREVTAIEIEARGECKNFEVVVHPYAIHIPGQSLVTTTVRRQFMMTNYSHFPAFFKWDTLSDCHIIEVQPTQGQIPGMTTIDLEVTVTGGRVGRVDHTLLCRIENQPKPLPLRVTTEIKGPEVTIDAPALDFGLMEFGTAKTTTFTVRNLSQVAAKFTLSESKEFLLTHPLTGKVLSELRMSVTSGELPPIGSEEVTVTFRPLVCRNVNSVIECLVPQGKGCFLSVRGDVQRPQVCLSSCILQLTEVYVGVAITQEITLINQRLIPAKFLWQKPRGPQSACCQVTFDPEEGELDPHEERKIVVTFVGNVSGDLGKLLLTCKVIGMENPVVLALTGEIKGLDVTYKIPPLPGDESFNLSEQLVLDLGSEVEIGSSPGRFIHITNHTAITAPFNIFVEHFVAGKPPTPPEGAKKPESSRRRGLLSVTSNLGDPKSKTSSQLEADYTKAILRDDRGAAFLAEPATGMLQPFSTLEVKVTAFSDMWGEYSDNIVCQVSDLAPTIIPVAMTVVGCPLKFQMATLKGQIPVVRFGTHVCGVQAIQRPLKIINNSPCDIRVDWRLFNLQEADPTLLDLIINIGDAFPLHDADGNEVIPPPVEYKTPQNTPQPEMDDAVSESTMTQSMVIAKDNNLLSHITEELEKQTAKQDEQLMVVTVDMVEHEGVPSEGPFTINKMQMVIPSRSMMGVVTYFTPDMKYLQDESNTDCVGYALGFLSLDKAGLKEIPGLLKRDVGYGVQPIRLDFTAYMKPAFLRIETSEEEGMVYRVAASKLLQVSEETISLHPGYSAALMATLSNPTQTPLVFRLATPQHFSLVDIDPVPKRDGEERRKRRPFSEFNTAEMITLLSQKNLKINVAFNMSLELVMHLIERLSPDKHLDSVFLTCSEGERKLHIRENLDICYNNTSVQRLPLYAIVTLPSLVISPNELNFGTCLVGQERSLEVTVTNITGSASFWQASLAADPNNDEETIFGIDPSKGYLEAHVTYVSKSKAILRVLFTARHNVPYEATFVFRGLLGEEERFLHVKGQGSYDNRHEALVNA